MYSPHLTDPNLTHQSKDWRLGGDSSTPGSSVFKYTGVHKCLAPQRPRSPCVNFGFVDLYTSNPTHYFS